MSKKRHVEEFEIPFVALMDTMTNVVGVLILVLVLLGLAVANAVKKILSELPPVTVEEYQRLKDLVNQKEIPDPKKLEEELEKLKKKIDDLKTLDTAESTQLVSIDDIGKMLEEKKKLRDQRKAEVIKLLEELDKAKAALYDSPKVPDAPATVVRLPNPRPYPDKPLETRIICEQRGVLLLNEQEYMRPILTKMDQVRSQFEYKTPAPQPFMPMLEKLLKSKAEAEAAWPAIAPLAARYQMDSVALAYKALKDGGLAPSTGMLEALGSISLVSGKPMPMVAAAVAAATKGDYSKWLGLDPSKDPTKPTIKVVPEKNKVAFHWGSSVEQVRPDQRGILGYFASLANSASFKDRAKSKVIYDAYKIEEFLKRLASTPTIGQAFTMAPQVKPGSTQAQVVLTPRTGEPVEKMKQPNSEFILTLRKIRANPSGVALFQILTGGTLTYLQARTIADEIGVPAAWEYRWGDLNVTLNIPGFEVQRFAEAPAPKPPTQTMIAPPKKSID